MFHIVLVHPEIPPNTGNVIRLAANTGCSLHLVEPLGFSMEDRQLQRAGLDYHEYARVERHADWDSAAAGAQLRPAAACSLSRHAAAGRLSDVSWQAGDWLVFGSRNRRPAGTDTRAVSRPTGASACRCEKANAA